MYRPDWNHTSVANGYRIVRCVGHPKAWKKGSYVYVHVIVAEQKLGRVLLDDEVAHHIDEDKLNNSPENIEVLQRGEHTSLHHRPPHLRLDQCEVCGAEFEHRKNPNQRFCSKSCAGVRIEFKHGTASAYTYRKCRCSLCRAFKTEQMRSWREARFSC